LAKPVANLREVLYKGYVTVAMGERMGSILHSRKKCGENSNYRSRKHNKAVWENSAGRRYNVFT
jgi:hypothetical protein